MSGARNYGGSAFPQVDSQQIGAHGEYQTEIGSYGGMSLRMYLAAQVLSNLYIRTTGEDLRAIARVALDLADAVIAEDAK